MALIDNAVYVDGRRVASQQSLALGTSGDLSWIGLLRPDPHELAAVADEFGLHENAVEDAQKGHQRAKLERYGDTLFVVLRPAWYRPDTGTVEFGEVHLFVGARFVVSVRHAERPDLA